MASPTILLVDDDIAVLTALYNLLHGFGYIVAGASSSPAAMNYVTSAKSRFDLIITDLAMPHIDGAEFISAAKKAFPDTPVIVVTGCTERCTGEEALRMGAFACLAKPVQTPQLISTIEQALHTTATATIRGNRRSAG